MKAHFGIAENRDGSPGLARKSGSQEIIDGSALSSFEAREMPEMPP